MVLFKFAVASVDVIIVVSMSVVEVVLEVFCPSPPSSWKVLMFLLPLLLKLLCPFPHSYPSLCLAPWSGIAVPNIFKK